MGEHTYILKISEMIEEGKIHLDIDVASLHVSHDGWCGIYKDNYCNCEPDIKYEPQPQQTKNQTRR